MRLVYLINTLGTGGAERHLLHLVQAMIQRGHTVHLIALKNSASGGARLLDREFREAGAEVHFLSSFGLSDVGRWFSLMHLLKQVRPDVLHSHLPRADLLASIAKFAYPALRWVSTIHDTYTSDKYSGHWIFPLLGWNWRRADRLIAVSKIVQAWCVWVFSVPLEKTRVIYHGVSIHAAAEDRPAHPHPVIGCLARFEKRKGLETLISAMKLIINKIPDAELRLAGSDPTAYSEVIKAQAVALGIENNVKIQGFCAAPLDFLRDLDVFAFASSSEGFGIVLLEAMSVKCPVVASDIYPINYIVQQGETGLLADPHDAAAFADAIVALLQNPAKRQAMGEAGYHRCAEHFSLDQSLDQVHKLYLELAAA